MSNSSEEWALHVRNVLMPNTIYLFVIMILGIVGNSLVLFVYAFKMKGVLEDRYFIPVLATLDLISSITVPVFLISDSLFWVSFPSGGFCKALFFLGTYFPSASSHILLLIALQRYLKICRPTGKQMNLFGKRTSIGIVLTLSLVYAAPLLYYYNIEPVSWTFKGENVTGTMCIMSPETTDGSEFYYVGLLFILSIGNIVGTVVLYAPIGCVIYKHFKPERLKQRQYKKDEFANDISNEDDSKSTATTSADSGTINVIIPGDTGAERGETKLKRNKNTTTNFNRMFFFIVLFYILFNLPTFVFIFLVRVLKDFWFSLSDTGLGICVFLSRTFILNHIVNPLIYGYFDVKFRAEIKKMQCPCFRKK